MAGMAAAASFTGGSDLFDLPQVPGLYAGPYGRFGNVMAFTNYFVSLYFSGIHNTNSVD